MRDLKFRRRRFAFAVVGAELVIALTLVLTGMSAGPRRGGLSDGDDINVTVICLPTQLATPTGEQAQAQAIPVATNQRPRHG